MWLLFVCLKPILRPCLVLFQPGEGGIILLDNGGEESSTDADSEDWISDPPSPCDVTFEGDNVLINGKSNLSRQPKQRKVR